MPVGLNGISFDREVQAKAGSPANPLVQPPIRQEGGIPSGDPPDPCNIESTAPPLEILSRFTQFD